MRSKFIYDIMAATPCTTFMFERICCVLPLVSPMDRMAGMVALDAGESDKEGRHIFLNLQHATVLVVGARVVSNIRHASTFIGSGCANPLRANISNG